MPKSEMKTLEVDVQTYKSQGKLEPGFSNDSLETGLLEAWKIANQPTYSRSPRRAIACPALYHMLKYLVFLEVAKTLLRSESVVVHGIFNSRPKLPERETSLPDWLGKWNRAGY